MGCSAGMGAIFTCKNLTFTAAPAEILPVGTIPQNFHGPVAAGKYLIRTAAPKPFYVSLKSYLNFQ